MPSNFFLQAQAKNITRQVVSFLSLFIEQRITDSTRILSDNHQNIPINKSFFQCLELQL